MALATKMPARSLAVVSVPFTGKNKDGDFKWMVKQPQYKNAMFVICENFLDMLSDNQAAGGGTACLRPYTMRGMGEGKVYRAAGIPTGWSTETQGFPCLDKHYSKLAIDLAFERLVLILEQQTDIDRVIYSCDSEDPALIGTNIFKDTIGQDVVKYISKSLHSIPKRLNVSAWTHEMLTEQEMRVYMYGILKHEYAKVLTENARLKSKMKMPSVTGSGAITNYGQKSLLRLDASGRSQPSPGPSLLGKRSGVPSGQNQLTLKRPATMSGKHPFLK